MSTKRTAVSKMTLDVFMPDIQKTVTVTQGDVNRRFEITLVDSGRPFRLGVKWTVALAAVKPSGARIYNSCIVDNGKIIYDFAGGAEIATEPGAFEVQFDIYDEVGEVLASPKIWLSVLVNRNREMQSEDQFTATQDILRRLNETEEQKLAMVEAALAKANEAAENAAKTATEVAESVVQEAVANANEAAQNAVQIATEAGERANAKANEAAEKAWTAKHQANAAYEIANSHEHSEYLTYSMMGIGNGVAKLDVWGKVPSSQLPSYVDDVLEYALRSAFPSPGEGGKIYVDTSTGISWRWSGSTYTKISSPEHTHTKSEITDFPTSMTPTAHNQAASTITAGTFAGKVVANASGQTPSVFCLRNSKLVSAEENPTVEGEIVWVYE